MKKWTNYVDDIFTFFCCLGKKLGCCGMRETLRMCSPVIMKASNFGRPFGLLNLSFDKGSHCSRSSSSKLSHNSGSCSGQLPLVRAWVCWWVATSGLWCEKTVFVWAPLLWTAAMSTSPPLWRCFFTVALIFGSTHAKQRKR